MNSVQPSSHEGGGSQETEEKWFTSREVAEKLGISIATLDRYKQFLLLPRGRSGLRARYTTAHVEKLRAHLNARISKSTPGEYDGMTAARVFKLVREGVSAVEIVEQLSLDPRTVRALLEVRRDLAGEMVLTTGDVAQIVALVEVPVASGKDVVTALARAVAKSKNGKTSPVVKQSTATPSAWSARQPPPAEVPRRDAADVAEVPFVQPRDAEVPT